MKKIILIATLTLLLPAAIFAQNYINKSKSYVLKGLKKYSTDNPTAAATISETDSTIVMNIPGSAMQPATFSYYFDQKGKCMAEKTKASCDSCLNKFLAYALQQKKFNWKKINENQYVSSYKKKLMIELPADNSDKSMSILRMSWSKTLYKMLAADK